MLLSIFLAKLIGLYMLAIAAIMLLRKSSFEESAKEVVSSRGLLIFAGTINLLIGIAIAIGHPILALDWRGLITFLGYLSIVQGVMRLAFPERVQEIGTTIFNGKWYWVIVGVVTLIGLFLTYKGFYH